MTSEAVKMMVIQTIEKEHLGFTLFHPDLSQDKGDCVFMIIPQNPKLLELDEVDLFLSIKETGEHKWTRLGNALLISQGEEDILKYGDDGFIEHIPTESRLGRWVAHTPQQ